MCLSAAYCGMIINHMYNIRVLHTNVHKRNIILNGNLYSGQTKVSIFFAILPISVVLAKWLFMGTEKKFGRN